MTCKSSWSMISQNRGKSMFVRPSIFRSSSDFWNPKTLPRLDINTWNINIKQKCQWQTFFMQLAFVVNFEFLCCYKNKTISFFCRLNLGNENISHQLKYIFQCMYLFNIETICTLLYIYTHTINTFIEYDTIISMLSTKLKGVFL